MNTISKHKSTPTYHTEIVTQWKNEQVRETGSKIDSETVSWHNKPVPNRYQMWVNVNFGWNRVRAVVVSWNWCTAPGKVFPNTPHYPKVRGETMSTPELWRKRNTMRIWPLYRTKCRGWNYFVFFVGGQPELCWCFDVIGVKFGLIFRLSVFVFRRK